MSEKNETPLCYTCQYRRKVAGSAHSKCAHPDAKSLGAMGAVTLGVTAEKHGVENCWFSWPYNFDPVWLETCNGYITKKDTEEV